MSTSKLRTVRAHFDSDCAANCGVTIFKGDDIRGGKGKWYHPQCAPKADKKDKKTQYSKAIASKAHGMIVALVCRLDAGGAADFIVRYSDVKQRAQELSKLMGELPFTEGLNLEQNQQMVDLTATWLGRLVDAFIETRDRVAVQAKRDAELEELAKANPTPTATPVRRSRSGAVKPTNGVKPARKGPRRRSLAEVLGGLPQSPPNSSVQDAKQVQKVSVAVEDAGVQQEAKTAPPERSPEDIVASVLSTPEDSSSGQPDDVEHDFLPPPPKATPIGATRSRRLDKRFRKLELD